MNVLLVEDEPGLREGLVSFLQLRGHVVHGVASRAEGVELAAGGAFDVVITDWRLGDGDGGEVVDACACPAVVMSGYPDEVRLSAERAVVMCKPVAPAALLEQLAALHARRTPAEPSPVRDPLAALPPDTRDRVLLLAALLDVEPGRLEIGAGVDVVLVRTPLPRAGDAVLERIERLGGDLRVLERDGRPQLELRLHRDGRPDGATVVGPDDPWPSAPTPVAIDFAVGRPCSPDAFVDLLRTVAQERERGRQVDVLNIPTYLRLHLETLGLDGLLPKRPVSGPRLPEVLQVLWS